MKAKKIPKVGVTEIVKKVARGKNLKRHKIKETPRYNIDITIKEKAVAEYENQKNIPVINKDNKKIKISLL